jgi:anaerobic magnesium-protoporphyrin IX monomethyl ester cyclase
MRDARSLVLVRLAPWRSYRNAHPRDLLWPVSMLYAAASAARDGWRTTILDGHVEDLDGAGLAQAAAHRAPDVVVVEFTTPSLAAALEFGREMRDRVPRAAIWAVGQHATERPADLLGDGSPFDGCLLGEYEASIAQLLAGAGRGPVEDSAVRGPGGEAAVRGGVRLVEDIDALPPLDPTGLPLDRYGVRSMHIPGRSRQRWGFLLTSRGCPFHCTFCSQTLRASHGRKFRGQSAEGVAADLARLEKEHGVTAVYMIDDCWSLDRDRVLRLCEAVVARGTKVLWAVQTRADCLDPEVLAALRGAGCRAIKIGVESGVDRVLGDLRKSVSRERIAKAVRDIRDSGIYLTACFMLGNPGETLEDMRESCRFALALGADMIQVSVHTPYPGSESYARFATQVGGARLSHYEGGPMAVGLLSPARLEAEQRRFYLHYYLHPGTVLRYVRRRGVDRLFDPDEWALVLGSVRFLLLRPRPAVAKRPR